MKRSTLGMLSTLIALAGMLLVSPGAYALDPPHNAYDTSNGTITCSSCHWDMSVATTPAWQSLPTTTSTQMDNLCMSCHFAGHYSDTTYADIQTHASANTSSTYGTWYIECRSCHNPHNQQQSTSYTTDPLVSVVTGSVVSVSTTAGAAQSSMVVSGPTLSTDGSLINLLVIPNIAYPTRMYRINSNTNNTITVAGAINPNYAKAGNTYSIRYGRFVKDSITTPNSGAKQVKFFSGNSFGTSTNKATATGVCQVCHTQTKYFNSSLTSTGWIQDGYGLGGSHPNTYGGTVDCTGCHTHKESFKGGGCDACHGNPPLVPSTLVYGSANGNDPTKQTGQTTAGAHLRHVKTLGYVCDTCHSGGMKSGADANKKIEMGFSIFGMNFGSYVTRTSLINTYTIVNGNGSTTISTPPVAMTCSTIYCHSTVQAGDGVGAPTYKSVNWAGTVQCGDCHNADGVAGDKSIMNTGSHTKHVATGSYAMACGTCHLNAGEGTPGHVNNSIDVSFDAAKAGTGLYTDDSGSTGNTAPRQGYGTCYTTYCHGNFTGGNSGNSAVWGTQNSGACGTCHGASVAVPPVNGAHSAHAGTGYAFGCNLCHYATTTNGTGITNYTNHADHNTDWQLSPVDARTNGGLYKGAATGSNTNVGQGYGTCTNLYCHSRGQASASPFGSPNTLPDWGQAATFPNDCTGCHDADKTAANKMHSGSHTAHVVSSGQSCNYCHSGTTNTAAMTITDFTKHVNSKVSISFTSLNPTGQVSLATFTEHTPGSSPVNCSALYCHGASGNPTWSTSNGTLGCDSCHKANNTLAGKHSMHFGFTGTATQADKSASSAPTGTFYRFSCGVCHFSTNHATGPVSWPASTIQAAEISFDGTVAGGGSYAAGGTIAGTDGGFNWTNGSCSATYCHSAGTSPYGMPTVTPTWNTASLDCAGCHGNSAGSSKLLTTGSHSVHINDIQNKVGRNLYCADCHNATASTATNFAISASANHVNKLVNIKFNNSLNQNSDGPTYESTSTTGTMGAAVAAGSGNNQCSNVYCHSNGNLTTSGGAVYGGAASFQTATWGASLNCDGCHGNQAGNSWPMYVSTGTNTYGSNSHRKHIESANHNCSTCHIGTTVSTVTSAASMTLVANGNHLNRIEDVSFRSIGTATGWYNAGTKTCSATYCHGTNPSVAWGGTTDCGSCHKSNNTLQGKHALHYGLSTTAVNAGPSNGSSGSTYNFGCGVCHFSTNHATGPVNGNQTAEVRFDPTYAGMASLASSTTYTAGLSTFADNGFNWTNGTCAMYCHSAGQSTTTFSAPATTLFDWNTASLDCAGCHGASTTSSKLLTSGAHSAHLNDSVKNKIGRSFGCTECHNATAATDTVIANTLNHVNRVVNIKFNNGSINLNTDNPNYEFTSTTGTMGAQVAAGGGNNQCSNVYCHSIGNLTGTNGSLVSVGVLSFRTPTWTSGTGLNCDACHGDQAGKAYPTYASGGSNTYTSNSHMKHIESANQTCNLCHVTTTVSTTITAATMTIVAGGTHLNRTEDVAFATINTKTGSYNPGTKTCSATYCHGTGPSVAWGGTTACNSCHDASSALSTGQTSSNRHSLHYASGVVSSGISTANTPSTTAYVYGCGNCHDKGQISHATGANDVKFNIYLSGTTPTNGTYTVGGSILTDNRGFNYSQNNTCNSVYCHSDANNWPSAGAISYKTVTWNQTAVSPNCGVCHAAAPTTNRHDTHVGQYNMNCSNCHNVTVNSGSTAISDKTHHVDGNKDVNFASVLSSTTTYDNVNHQCSNVYCHSQGTSATTFNGAFAAPTPTLAWNGASLACNACHTGGYATGPTYPNGSPKANSHAKHVTTTTGVCENCHYTTTTTGTTIATTGLVHHADKNYDVAPGAPVSFTVVSVGTFTSPTTCSNISCHGGTTASVTWGSQSVTCTSCHLAAADVRNDTYGDGIVAVISSTQWLYSGHGRTNGFYDGTSNTVANLVGKAGTGNPCLYCHDQNVAHGDTVNVYRLRTSSTGTNMNDVCWNCHTTGAAGVNPFSGTSATVVAASKVDKYHFGGEHATTRNGGQFCWDCHTGHGDSTSTAGPIAMFRNKPWMQSSSTGTPITMVSTTVTFTSVAYPISFSTMTNPLAYPSTSGAGNVCNVCHVTAQDTTMTHYTTTGSDGHNAGQVCTSCHSHSANTTKDGGAFAGAGGCNGCHGYPPSYISLGSVSSDGGKAYIGSAKLGKGAHAQHVVEIMSATSYTWGALDPLNDTFTGGKVRAVCGVCHDTSTSSNHQDSTRELKVPTFYQFGPTAPVYNGDPSTATNKSCSNVSCHFQDTPLWQQTAGQ